MKVMDNIGAILKESGLSYDKLVKTTILLSSMDHFEAVNSIYGCYSMILYLIKYDLIFRKIFHQGST